MKILFVISDLWKNSVDRQLAEIIQEFLDGEAETEILESFEVSEHTRTIVELADAVWFVIQGQNDSCLNTLTDFVEKIEFLLNGKYCALASIGRDDGGEGDLKDFYRKIRKLNMKVMDNEVTCVPLKTERFECPKIYQIDLFWQKESFLKFCNAPDTTEDRNNAIVTVANNYLVLMKNVSKDKRKPSHIKINYPNIITDVGSFEFNDLTKDLKELHYEIDALTSDYYIENEEIERALKTLIDKQWY